MFWLKNKISFIFLVKYKKIKGGEKDKNFFILYIYFFIGVLVLVLLEQLLNNY